MKKKACRPRSDAGRSYPSVLELAMKAGKWSVLVGGGALIIGGATGCEEVSTPGVVELDGWADETQVNEDIGIDQNVTGGVPIFDVNDWKEDIQTSDAVDVVEVHGDDGDLFDSESFSEGLPYETYDDLIPDTGDVVEADQGVPLPGEAPFDVIADPGDVVTSDADVDPGLGGDPIVDIFSGDSDAVDVLPE